MIQYLRFACSEDYDTILERLCERLQTERGITFTEFKDFCQFLNNMDDFQIAMRMYTLADKPISQVCNAVKCAIILVHDDTICRRSFLEPSTSALGSTSADIWFTQVQGSSTEQKQTSLVRLVFQIFDDDGDGLLSYQEFVAMMKDRIHRGLKTHSRQEGWQGFKQCVKREMRESS